MSVTQQIYSYYHAPVISGDMNERFSDILGGSILGGYRLALGSTNSKISLVRSGDVASVLVTWRGVKVVESDDIPDAVTLAPNTTSTDRVDSIYVVYVHGEPFVPASYVVLLGDAIGNPAPEPTRLTYTLIGYVRVTALNGPITGSNLTSRSFGLSSLRVGGTGTIDTLNVNFALYAGGAISTGSPAATRTNIDVYNKLETRNVVAAATAQAHFVQAAPIISWVLTHNLSRFPKVSILDSTGNEVWADIKHISNMQITITFAVAFAGEAYLY